MKLLDSILGTKTAYEGLRPAILGGFNDSFKTLFESLDVKAKDRILDIGCGMGIFFDYIDEFESYYGIDEDEYALGILKERTKEISKKVITSKDFNIEAVREFNPTMILLKGLIHHLSDNEMIDLLNKLGSLENKFILSSYDVYFRKGDFINNILCRLDRVKHVRNEQAYLDLFKRSNFKVKSSLYTKSGNSFAKYIHFFLEKQ